MNHYDTFCGRLKTLQKWSIIFWNIVSYSSNQESSVVCTMYVTASLTHSMRAQQLIQESTKVPYRVTENWVDEHLRIWTAGSDYSSNIVNEGTGDRLNSANSQWSIHQSRKSKNKYSKTNVTCITRLQNAIKLESDNDGRTTGKSRQWNRLDSRPKE